MEERKVLPVGCMFDGARGFSEQNRLVQKLAIEYGWTGEPIFDDEHEEFMDAGQEANEYLEDYEPYGHWVGFHDGDFGVWPNEDSDEIRCDQCNPSMIQGVFAHESGCPNMRKVWDSEEREWVRPEREEF